MTILLGILLIVCLWKLKIPGYHPDFLSSSGTLPIKGVFTFLVLYSHMRGYVTLTDSWVNSIYCSVQDRLGQLIVAMFMFYSGFGIWESFTQKPDYEHSFLKRRFLKTLMHFEIVVVAFIMVQSLIPITYPLRNYLFCWIGWESVGNSNWFIFDILVLYLISFIAMSLHRRGGYGGILISFILTLALWLFLRRAGKAAWWIDTLTAFPLGMFFSRIKPKLQELLSKKRMPYFLTAVFFVLWGVTFKTFGGVDIYGVTTCMFCCLIVMGSSWVRIGNPILDWAGKNLFSIYMLQRLPMLVLTALGVNENPVMFIILSVVLTCLLAEFLSRLLTQIDAKLFNA